MAVAGVVLVALLSAPAPLLPPNLLAELVQSRFGIGWEAAYLLVAIGLQIGFYGAAGVLASLAVNRAMTWRGRLAQIAFLPLVVVAVAVIIRSVKLGHLPMLANAFIPIAACMFGVALGLGLLYRRWTMTLIMAVTVIGATLWIFLGGVSAELGRDTEASLRQLVAAAPHLPSDERRFGALLQTAFAAASADIHGSPVQRNRAAILAVGITLGHERLSRFAGLDAGSELVRAATSLRKGATLRGRDDWSRHYTLSAALTVVESPLVSDAGGLLKEELDALARGSGFSFGDLAADRAGVRFATAATCSENNARAMQARFQNGFAIDDFFPPVSDLAENLTVEQFRQQYGGVGSQRYREQLRQIEARLDSCAGLCVSMELKHK